MSKDAYFRRDFETVEEFRARVEREIQSEPITCETDLAKVLEEQPSPWVVDCGPGTSRADRDAIQAEQDRWARWERMGR